MVSRICACGGVVTIERVDVDLREPDLGKSGIQKVLDFLGICSTIAAQSYELRTCQNCKSKTIVAERDLGSVGSSSTGESTTDSGESTHR